jgi:excisionase family DNA binding protein
MNKLLTKRETAGVLTVSERTIDRLVSEGRLRAVKIRGAVRFTERELERFIISNTTKINT